MCADQTPAVFTPGNEPYLGRPLLFQFDQLISSALELNAEMAPRSHDRALSDGQRMACIVIPQTLSIALSIRELVRQGYLFGGHVLARPLLERACILLYLHLYPNEIERWNRGWSHGDAPSLSKMLDAIQKKNQSRAVIPGNTLTATLNSLLHAKPDSGQWNIVALGDKRSGHAVSKILDRPDLCDDLCASTMPWMVVVMSMMATYFAAESSAEEAPRLSS
jgi:hypothetical protein